MPTIAGIWAQIIIVTLKPYAAFTSIFEVEVYYYWCLGGWVDRNRKVLGFRVKGLGFTVHD